MLCCGNKKSESELDKIRAEAKAYAIKKNEIVVVYKWMGFYNYALTLPVGATLIEYISQYE